MLDDQDLGEPRASKRWRRTRLAAATVLSLAVVLVLLATVSALGGGVPNPLGGASLDAYEGAIRAFADRIASIRWTLLFAGLLLATGNAMLRARAWRTILRAAYPEATIRWWRLTAATYVGTGANAILPARLGDPVRLFLVHRKVAGTTYPTLAASLLAETAFDAVVGTAILLYAWGSGAIPALPDIPNLPLFEIAWYARHPTVVAVTLVLVLIAALVWQRRVRTFWRSAAQGIRILRTPTLYLRGVVVYQALGWCCRLAATWFFLKAFGIPATLGNALLVQVASSVATLFPVTPGGLGPRQALTVLLLAGEASSSSLLAFGVGMELALTVWNIGIGVVCFATLIGGFRFRHALREARLSRDRVAAGP